MLLSGHEGEVYCCKFHPNGNTLASAGFDRLICELLAGSHAGQMNFLIVQGGEQRCCPGQQFEALYLILVNVRAFEQQPFQSLIFLLVVAFC